MIESFGLRALSPGAVVEDVNLGPAMRQQVIEAVSTDLDQFYVYPELAKKMSDAIRSACKAG